MNTLIEIALTTQPLKARHSATAELLCLSGRGHACRWRHTHLDTCTYTRTFKKAWWLLHTTYPWPSHKHTQRASHSTLYKTVTHTYFLTTHTSHIIPALTLQHRLSLSASSATFPPFLSGFLSLFSWISGESNYISVGLAAWRWRAVWLWANTWPRLEEQSRRRRCSADRCAAGSLACGEALKHSVCVGGLSFDGEHWSTNVRTHKMCVCLFVNHVWVWLNQWSPKTTPITSS